MKRSLLLLAVVAVLFFSAGSAAADTYPNYTWNTAGIDTSIWYTNQAGSFFSQPGDGYLHVSAPSANTPNNFINTKHFFSPGIEFWMPVYDFYTPILSGTAGSLVSLNLVKPGSAGAYNVGIMRHAVRNGFGNFYATWTSGGTLQQSAIFNFVDSAEFDDIQLGVQWSGDGQITLAYKLGTDPQSVAVPLLTVANPGFTQATLSINAGTSQNPNLTANIGTVSSDPFQPVPLPGAVWLLGSGLLGLEGWRRKFKKS